MLWRTLRYGSIGAVTLATGISLHANNYDPNSLGVVRLGRSALAVIDVSLLYKRELYYRDWDTNSHEYKEQRSVVHRKAAERLLQLIRTNKGVYIKVGQHIGALDYLLPKEFVETMRVLHSNAPQNPLEDLYKVIRQDLQCEPHELFESFESEPLGTASLAQVHRATLKNGETVAVKIQHPYVRGNSRVDIKSMELAVKVLALIFPDFKIQWLVDESKRNLPIEMDFLNEGRNAEKIRSQFQKYDWLRIPKIYWEISTPRVLVMEYLEGGQVNDLKYLQQNKIDPLTVSNRIGQLYSEMIFNTGFVHSDPHPGNILVHKSPKTQQTQIILLDHGLYADLSEQFRTNYSKFWMSILNVDRVEMRQSAQNLGIKGNLYGLFACMVAGRSWDTITHGVSKVKYSKAEKRKLQENTSLVLPQISDVLQQVDRQMLLILKTNDLIRGIESTLQTQNRMTAFWVMSKCCVQTKYEQEKRQQPRATVRFRMAIRERWELFKLDVYYLCLGLMQFGPLQALKHLLSS